MKDQFKSLDGDGDGYVTVDEFVRSIKNSGRNPDEFDTKGFFAKADKTKDGKITFNEFLEAAEHLGLVEAFTATGQSSKDSASKNTDAFTTFDRNHDGKITSSELGDALRAQGQNPTDSELNEMMKAADANNDGTVDKNELSKVL